MREFSSKHRCPGSPFSPLLQVIGATPESTFNSFYPLLVFLGRYRHLHWGCVYPAFPEPSGFRDGPTGFRLLGFSLLLVTPPRLRQQCSFASPFLSFAKAPGLTKNWFSGVKQGLMGDVCFGAECLLRCSITSFKFCLFSGSNINLISVGLVLYQIVDLRQFLFHAPPISWCIPGSQAVAVRCVRAVGSK